AVPDFLKNDGSGTGYAVSSSRHALFGGDGKLLRDEVGKVVKASNHGMGGIIPPDGMSLAEFAACVWEIPVHSTRAVEGHREVSKPHPLLSWKAEPLR